MGGFLVGRNRNFLRDHLMHEMSPNAPAGPSGAHFQSLSEPWADTTSYVGKFIMTIFAGLAEFERELIRERPVDAACDLGVRQS